MQFGVSGDKPVFDRQAQRALQDMAAHAKKQLEQSGSLEGFSEEYMGTSAEGVVKISVSAIAAALYDKSAEENDYILAFKMDSDASDGSGAAGGGSGSSLTIKSVDQIDAFAAETIDLLDDMRWLSFSEATPEEVEAYQAREQAKLRSQPGYVELQVTGAGGSSQASNTSASVSPQKTAEEPNGKLARAREENNSANQLVAKLQEFLDGLKGKPKETPDSSAKTDMDTTAGTALSRFLERVDTSA